MSFLPLHSAHRAAAIARLSLFPWICPSCKIRTCLSETSRSCRVFELVLVPHLEGESLILHDPVHHGGVPRWLVASLTGGDRLGHAGGSIKYCPWTDGRAVLLCYEVWLSSGGALQER